MTTSKKIKEEDRIKGTDMYVNTFPQPREDEKISKPQRLDVSSIASSSGKEEIICPVCEGKKTFEEKDYNMDISRSNCSLCNGKGKVFCWKEENKALKGD